ncbi:TetR/AcrR family transcriptional regulator [Chitinophaga pendula]|uniref:TetR/AcrR family transcriptional regulator n=1 Tax=Chitinophaga TaxID=79328 RepID=UPI000BAF6FDD|nr:MULTISPECIES: TetR/AcrR family transcriptional regulator [Chitinophaga]ASZ12695.1 TetR family transcriptional regulator [Chitinophaga sp. MD30]UCJ09693.1 TetR/AcrR family transcriptional regulator [Chitinophaga pendula]
MARNKAFDPEERLEKAKDLFWEKGYNATSMQDIVDAMGLNRASIYDTYGDKHSLFLQCLTSYAVTSLEDYCKAGAVCQSPLLAVEKIVKRAVQRTLEEDHSCMVAKSAFELADTDSRVKEIIKTQGDKLHAVITTLLQKAQQAGEVKADKDPAILARFIIASFGSFWQVHITEDNPQLVQQLGNYLLLFIRQ